MAEAPKKSVRPSSGVTDAVASAKPAPEKFPAAPKHNAAPSRYRFQRSKAQGLIQVLNENSYVMADYSERTGSLKWRRVVLASERSQIETWLRDRYPTP